MRETGDDLRVLQDLLDRSYEAAGAHLRGITTPERRLSAADVSERLTGMCLLVLATVSSDCRPFNGPVDGVFFPARSTSVRVLTRCGFATSEGGRR